MFQVMTLSGTVPARGAAHWLEEIGKKTRAKMHESMPHRPVKTLVTIFSFGLFAGLTRNGTNGTERHWIIVYVDESEGEHFTIDVRSEASYSKDCCQDFFVERLW